MKRNGKLLSALVIVLASFCLILSSCGGEGAAYIADAEEISSLLPQRSAVGTQSEETDGSKETDETDSEENETASESASESETENGVLAFFADDTEPEDDDGDDFFKSAGDDGVQTYVLNNNTKRFHYPSCVSAGKIKDENKETYEGTRAELIERGYKPCGNCDP